MVPIFAVDLNDLGHTKRSQTPSFAKPSTKAPPPLSPLQQQRGFRINGPSDRPSISPASHSQAIAPTPALLEQSLLQCDRPSSAQSEPAMAEQANGCPPKQSDRYGRKLFYSNAVEAPAMRERPNPIEVYVPSLFVMGMPCAALVPVL